MPALAAFLVPGTPLPVLCPGEEPYRPLRSALDSVGAALAAASPDVLLVYSTRWIAVLDALWQTRSRLEGVHVDEVWHEHGELPHDIRVDVELAEACVGATNALGLRAKGVDYDAFPVDTGTVVATGLAGGIPAVVCANNIYHSAETTETLGALAIRVAEEQGKTAAVLAVGGLSTGFHHEDVALAEDRVSEPEHDELNRRLVDLLAAGDDEAVRAFLPEYGERVRADGHMKHLYWLLGATGGFEGASVLAYGPDYGAGAAVVEFEPTRIQDAEVVDAEVVDALEAEPARPLDAGRTSPPVWRATPPRRSRRAAGRSWSGPGR